MEVWEIIQAALPSLLVGVVMALFNRGQKKRDAATREREAARLEAENVQVSLLVASAKLSYALAMAVKRGAPNGEVEDGVEQYREAMKAFKRLERKLVAQNNSEGVNGGVPIEARMGFAVSPRPGRAASTAIRVLVEDV